MSTQPVPFLTPEQYLKIEREAEFRSEYLNGQMFAMAGATRNHSWIVANTLTQLTEQLLGQTCGAAGSDLRLYSTRLERYTYPDVVITCGPDRFLDDHKDTIVDATAIVEVLSPSTRNYDRGEKFVFYRSLPSFAEYLLLAQDTIRAEHHVRQPNGSWLFSEFTSVSDVLDLRSISCQLVLGQLYRRVEFGIG